LQQVAFGYHLKESGELYAIPAKVGHSVHRASKSVLAHAMLKVGHKETLWPVVIMAQPFVVSRHFTASVEEVGVLVVRLKPASKQRVRVAVVIQPRTEHMKL